MIVCNMSQSSYIMVSSLAIALTDTNVNGKVTVTELHDYAEEGQCDFKYVSHSV